MRYFYLFLFIVSSITGFSQIPDSIRFDWKVSGEESVFKLEKSVNVLAVGFGNNGVFDNTLLLQSLINSHQSDSQLVIYFPVGSYKFTSTIYLKSGITIEGEGATKTKLIFDNAGTGSLFEISASQNGNFFSVKKGLNLHSKIIELDSPVLKNQYYEFLVDGDGLATSDWAMSSIGQIFKIDSTFSDSAFLSSELKLDYYKYNNPRIRLIKPIRDVHFKYFLVERLDKSTGQTSNINFYYATNCTVIGIESNKTNMSHLTLGKSYRCRVVDSYFHHAHDYGGGGKAYGVELRYSTSNCLVENNIFDNLRHGILLQAGPNGNVISGNFSINPFWKEGIFPANSAGELVLHGNYPFANLFEGNEVGNIVVDNSHGINGPGNVFYRNKATLWGVLMNTGAGHATHFIGNEITGTLNVLTGNGNVNYVNFTTTTDLDIFKNITVPQSLYLKNKPLWWPTKKEFPALGLPKSKLLAHIPASYRYNHDSLRALKSTADVFILNFENSFIKIKDLLSIELESKLQVNIASIVLEKFNTKHKVWLPITPDLSNGILFKTDTISETIVLANENSCYRWAANGIKNQKWIGDSFCVNNETGVVKNLKPNQIMIYPNPIINFLNIKLTKSSTVNIFNIYGSVLFSQNFNDGVANLDLTKWANGNYVIEVFDGINYYRQMIIKQ